MKIKKNTRIPVPRSPFPVPRYSLLITALALAALFGLCGRAAAGQTVYNLYKNGFTWDSSWSTNYCGKIGNMYTSATGATAQTTYQDTVPPGTAVTSILMDVGALMFCNGASLQVKLDGTVVATINSPATCQCTSAGAATTGISIAAGTYGALSQQKTISILNGTGGTGVISALWTTTLAANYTDPIIKITFNYPNNSMTYPQQAVFAGTTTPTFTWTNVGGASVFELQVSTDPFFNYTPFINKTGLGSATYTLSGTGNEILSDGVSYYVRARATNGSDTAWTPIVDFGVMTTPPSAANLLTPGTDVPTLPSAVNITTPTFNWSIVTTGQ